MISILYGLQETRYLMELTIFGATGGTGTCLTEQALAAGHQVTAVVRDPARMSVPAPGCGSSRPT
jgi:NADPH:quinone reductase-like Zn-dependent oxidoreductase